MNQKTNIHNASSFIIPRYNFHLANSRGEQQEAPLTQTETQLHKILQKTRASSVIGKAISIGISSGPGTFRKLISELQDQQCDSPALLEKVIGKQAIELLNVLSHN